MSYDLKTLEFPKVLSILKRYAKTEYAKEKIESLSPTYDFEVVKNLQEETKEAFQALVQLDGLPFDGLYPLKNCLKKVSIGGILQPEELLGIVNLLDQVSHVLKYFNSLEAIKISVEHLKKYGKELQQFPALKTSITLAIKEDGSIVDNASRELFTIRRSLASLQNRLKSKLNELLISKSSMLTESLIVMRDNRMCLPVKIEFKNTFKGILHDISSSNTTCYIEPEETIATTSQIESYEAMEKKEIQVILKNLSLLVAAEAEALLKNFEILTSLDIIYAKASMAKDLDYHAVHLTDDGHFQLKKARHPLIPADQVVPIDIALGSEFQGMIITGPNTGGKTVVLKTVGLLHAMMMCGMMLPCSGDSILSIYREILVDIGDEQSLEQSLSTFSAHLTKMKEILSLATNSSLILLDELGSGTDPKEGSSLAISMIDYLIHKNSKLIVTTHYSDLKSYAYKNDRIVNASVEFNSLTLAPTYRLLVGVPGKSNAIEIATRLGLPDEIIVSSKSYLEGLDNSQSSLLLSNLEEEMNKIRVQEEELLHKIEMYDSLNAKLSADRISLTKQKDKIMEDARNEAKQIVSKAKEDSAALLAELKELRDTDFEDHQLSDLKHKAKTLKVEENDNTLFEEDLVVGDYVFIKSYEKNGTITRIKKDKYTVQFGPFSMDFEKNDLLKAVKPKEKPVKQTRASGYNPASHASLSLDLRGKRYEEVKDLMDSYFDQAILGNLETVSIIHGFGTGTIRKAVWEYLKNCPYAKSYRYGQEGEGLNGVTIVKLK